MSASCLASFQDYGLRAIGYGQRILPKSDITLCDQFALIGSGLIWNVFFGVLAVCLGYWFAMVLAVGKASERGFYRRFSSGFIFLFRGSPLFIQFFFAYELFVLLPKVGVTLDLWFVVIDLETRWLTRAWLGALLVLIFNTTAYSAEIFYGALRSSPRGEIEAANAYGMTPWQMFWKVQWPNMMRLAWPSYTNEAIFLFHSTTLVFFSGFPAWRQSGDALYYASYFADKTFNPFVPYPIIAFYFIVLTLLIIFIFGLVNRRLNRHLPDARRPRLIIRLNLIR
ncbi:MAG: ABC transporter permease subunit [Proteobacteria bacterium]|nr:ABC transporter permease subunit [Alphaproteobacteria bacterium]MDA0307768.1 ABC transporter permease subunit [Pseudomonadota bacterium]MDA0908294.1 ABC transporter permease subunit [Pseudomonadota bacterium]NBR38059.1 ABC transporter permease subunit [Alphaproteobacteria bacterium]